MEIPREVLLGALLVALVLLAFVTLRAMIVRWARRRRIHGRLARAGEGELRAARWLERRGFTIVGVQVEGAYEVLVDGEPVVIGVRADYLVEKGDARLVAEVKTGSVATRIETPATRRQLLEYRVAFDCDGILLVDAEAGAIHEVRFPGVGTRRTSRIALRSGQAKRTA